MERETYSKSGVGQMALNDNLSSRFPLKIFQAGGSLALKVLLILGHEHFILKSEVQMRILRNLTWKENRRIAHARQDNGF
jgi:hypothetical protein